jgi:hypothetical protein
VHHEGSSTLHHQSLPIPASDIPTTFAYLNYLLEHNEHHSEELHALGHQLDDLGFSQAAEAVEAAMHHYAKGNAELAHALKEAPATTDKTSAAHDELRATPAPNRIKGE